MLRALIALVLFASSTAVAQDHYFEGEITLPEIPRHLKLPTRLLLRSEFQPDVIGRFYRKEFTPFFVKMLSGDYDSDLYCDAANALERIARNRFDDPKIYTKALSDRLQATDSIRVKRACAMALIAADARSEASLLIELCTPAEETVGGNIEEWLISWKSDVLLKEWTRRVNDPRSDSRDRVVLACRGLAALNESAQSQTLLGLVADRTVPFKIRQAAAESAALLDSAASTTLATDLSTGTVLDQVLAVRLLGASTTEPALNLLEILCDADTRAVAAVAWRLMYLHDSKRLLSRLEAGAEHGDSEVRHVAVLVAGDHATPERCQLLNTRLGDVHIAVRNSARRVLQNVTKDHPELKDQILAAAGTNISSQSANWQQLEQSCFLLGVLRHDVYQQAGARLLTHQRPEVFCAASWLLHMMPQSAQGDAAVRNIYAAWERIRYGKMTDDALANALRVKIQLLSHVVAYTRFPGLDQFCIDQLNKESQLQPTGRAIALWAWGRIYEGTGKANVHEQLHARLYDPATMPPEDMIVKAACALGIAWVRKLPDAVKSLKGGFGIGGIDPMVERCLCTGLEMLGEEAPELERPVPVPYGGWKLFPSSKTAGASSR